MLLWIGSGLIGRPGLDARRGVKFALGWLAIFAVVFVIFGLRDEIGDWTRANLGEQAVVEGSTLRVPRSDDGHFWVEAQVNGRPVRMLVDSGATVTTLGARTAERLGIEPSSPFPAAIETANGVVEMQRAQADDLRLGTIRLQDLPVHINPADNINVLGMNALSRLKRSSLEGRWLVLEP